VYVAAGCPCWSNDSHVPDPHVLGDELFSCDVYGDGERCAGNGVCDRASSTECEHVPDLAVLDRGSELSDCDFDP